MGLKKLICVCVLSLNALLLVPNSFWLDFQFNSLPSVILFQGFSQNRGKQSKMTKNAQFSNLKIRSGSQCSQNVFKKPIRYSESSAEKIRKIPRQISLVTSTSVCTFSLRSELFFRKGLKKYNFSDLNPNLIQ